MFLETEKLYNGAVIPRLGLGTWQVPNAIAADVVRNAIAAGYRHIDTAAAYENEEGVGKGIVSACGGASGKAGLSGGKAAAES